MYIVGFSDGELNYYLDLVCSTFVDACDITAILFRAGYEVHIFKRDEVPEDYIRMEWEFILKV